MGNLDLDGHDVLLTRGIALFSFQHGDEVPRGNRC